MLRKTYFFKKFSIMFVEWSYNFQSFGMLSWLNLSIHVCRLTSSSVLDAEQIRKIANIESTSYHESGDTLREPRRFASLYCEKTVILSLSCWHSCRASVYSKMVLLNHGMVHSAWKTSNLTLPCAWLRRYTAKYNFCAWM